MAKRDVNRIQRLLEGIVADFPRRKQEAEELMKKYGLEETLTQRIKPAERVSALPTFSKGVRCPITPMLKARFDFAGSWNNGGDIWLSPSEMERWMNKKSVLVHHRALREEWDESAPMLFPDDRLTLYAVTQGVPENLTYLVWGKQGGEPEVWSYVGQSAERFSDLEQYLNWCLHRE